MTEKNNFTSPPFPGKALYVRQNVILKQSGQTGGMAQDVKPTQNNPWH
jgi:hypothetical protein